MNNILRCKRWVLCLKLRTPYMEKKLKHNVMKSSSNKGTNYTEVKNEVNKAKLAGLKPETLKSTSVLSGKMVETSSVIKGNAKCLSVL